MAPVARMLLGWRTASSTASQVCRSRRHSRLTQRRQQRPGIATNDTKQGCTKVYLVGVWFGFDRLALLLAVVLGWVDRCFYSWVLLGLFCLLPPCNTKHGTRNSSSNHERPVVKPVKYTGEHTGKYTVKYTRVTRRKQHRSGIAPNANTTHVPTAGSSAALTKPNHTPTRHPRAKGKILLRMVTPHAA